MTSAAQCIAAVQAAFNPVPGNIGTLLGLRGYAYQAFVFERLGTELCALPQWNWSHPPLGPTFPKKAGATFTESVGSLSCCIHTGGQKWFLQELTVVGDSGAPHNLDGTILKTQGQAMPHHPPRDFVAAAVECKNHGRNVSMDIAREVVGLGLDVVGSAWPRRARVTLVVASDATASAVQLVEAYGHRVLTDANPVSHPGWHGELGRRLRYS